METLTGVRSDSVSDDQSSRAHRQLIGYIGLVLPILLILIVLARDGVETWIKLDSISAYYYTGAVAAFVGMLIALALFLFTYSGYQNNHYWADRTASIAAAVAALGVAFFPTKAPADVPALPWWSPATGVLHFVSALVLFTMFAVFALWLFRVTSSGKKVLRDKQWRNRVFLLCGLTIVASIIWAIVAKRNGDSIFWPESFALMAFALSWLVKGYAHTTISNATRLLFQRFMAQPADKS